jgi:hypothetical protein
MSICAPSLAYRPRGIPDGWSIASDAGRIDR